MSILTRRYVAGGIAGLVVVGLGSTLVGHTDDPKEKSILPKYEGPGYRAAIDGPLAGGEFDADGVTLRSWVPINEFAGNHSISNDCWGYTSPSGREYALVGLQRGTGFVEITDPDNAVVIETIAGPRSTWGDVKTYGTYAYAVTENDDGAGIQVIDLSDIDNGNVTLVNQIDVGNGTGNTHNIVIDEESGFLYRVGGSWYGMGVYDLNQNAVNPPQVGEWTARYIHDMEVITYTEGPYAGRQIAYTCGGDNGGWQNTGLEIVDVTDKDDIFSVKRFFYANGSYSHQIWLDEAGEYAYLNDELDEIDLGIDTNTKIIDVSDIENPVELTGFTNGNPAIGHNLYMRGDLIFEANYSSGLRVFDASDREAPVEIAYFDTRPEGDETDFYALWGTYPFFPSGTVIGSDEQRGLFVWRVDALDPNQCPNDLDESGEIDFGDLLLVLEAWGDKGGPADLDGSGEVDFGDILIILEQWGDVCP